MRPFLLPADTDVTRETPQTPDEAARRLGALDAPVLLRLPFSHFCRKAEWGLSHCGIPYRALDVDLRGMRHVKRANPVERTVPVMVDGTRVLHGSHAILRWADDRRASGTPRLYPDDVRKEVLDWEAWADREIGPAVRREAYRVLASDPSPYARTTWQRVRLYASRGLFRTVLAYLKADRHEHEDAAVLVAAVRRIAERLEETNKGYLFGNEPTGADIATAALIEPLVPLGEARGYQAANGWGAMVQYVRTVRPDRLRRTSKRRVKEEDWRALEFLNKQQVTLQRPLAGE